MSDYTPTTDEVRYKWCFDEEDVYESAEEFDRWFQSEIEKAARTGAEEALRIVKDEWFPDED